MDGRQQENDIEGYHEFVAVCFLFILQSSTWPRGGGGARTPMPPCGEETRYPSEEGGTKDVR